MQEQALILPTQTNVLGYRPRLRFALYLFLSLIFLSVLIASAVFLVLMFCGVIYLTPVLIGICATLFLLGMNAKAWHLLSDTLFSAWQAAIQPVESTLNDVVLIETEHKEMPVVDESQENALLQQDIMPYYNPIMKRTFDSPIAILIGDIDTLLFAQLPHRDLMQLRGVNRGYRVQIDRYIQLRIINRTISY